MLFFYYILFLFILLYCFFPHLLPHITFSSSHSSLGRAVGISITYISLVLPQRKLLKKCAVSFLCRPFLTIVMDIFERQTSSMWQNAFTPEAAAMRSASPVPSLPLWLIDNVRFFMPPFVRLICHRTRADWSMEKSTQREEKRKGEGGGRGCLSLHRQFVAHNGASRSSVVHVVVACCRFRCQ